MNSYVYDAENRLVASSQYSMTLTYDPLGRLWQTTSTVMGNSQFLSDGDHVVLEYDGSNGGIRRRFMWGPGVDEVILEDSGGTMNCSGTHFLNTDHQGSIIAVADCSGQRTNVNGYDEYGIPNGDNWGRFQYTGQAWLADLGMYYYKARMYSATLGRFLQVDPIGYKDQVNLYQYAGDDPVDGRDSTGTTCTVSNGVLACHIDAIRDLKGNITLRADFTKAQSRLVSGLDKSYTASANNLAAHPDRKTSISLTDTGGRTRTGTTTAGVVASALADRTMVYQPGNYGGSTLGNVTTFGDGVRMGLPGRGMSGSAESNRQIEIVHEGLHGIYPKNLDSQLVPAGGIGESPYQAQHQLPYNQASETLLGMPR